MSTEPSLYLNLLIRRDRSTHNSLGSVTPQLLNAGLQVNVLGDL